MSKYFKADDVLAIFSEEERPLNWTDAESEIQAVNDFDCYKRMIESIPTIEVSEDCISKHDIWKIIEDNAYWVRYNENSTEKGMTLTGINQALNECPLVAPTVSEDCISREQVRAKLDYISYAEKDPISIAKRIVDDAPSVVPKPKEGEWISKHNGYWTCSECGLSFLFYAKGNYCPNCGAKMKGMDNGTVESESE